jgi:carbon storage regulator
MEGHLMLVLTRRNSQKIVIDDCITITIVEVRGRSVRLGIEAPREVPVHRDEVQQRISAEKRRAQRAAAGSSPASPSQTSAAWLKAAQGEPSSRA